MDDPGSLTLYIESYILLVITKCHGSDLASFHDEEICLCLGNESSVIRHKARTQVRMR
jgi:hypothetical protein